MGLDAVELVMRTEDEFSITVSDDEAATALTVGEFYRVVLAKLDVSPGCLTSKAFYTTRRALVDALGVPRRSIRPSTRLSPLLPDETRKEQWELIKCSLGLSMPGLRIHGDLKQDIYKRTFFFGSLLAILACIIGLSLGWHGLVVFPLAFVLWIALAIASLPVVERLSIPRYASELPADTAGELAQVVLSLNQDRFQPTNGTVEQTNEDVWRRLVDIICDQLQVAREEVVPNARFVDDLGVS
jgi:acyl carrier protein